VEHNAKDGIVYDFPSDNFLKIFYDLVLLPKSIDYSPNIGDYYGIIRRMCVSGLVINMESSAINVNTEIHVSHKLLDEWLQTAEAKRLWLETEDKARFDLSKYSPK
jgi:hypothetical protein